MYLIYKTYAMQMKKNTLKRKRPFLDRDPKSNQTFSLSLFLFCRYQAQLIKKHFFFVRNTQAQQRDLESLAWSKIPPGPPISSMICRLIYLITIHRDFKTCFTFNLLGILQELFALGDELTHDSPLGLKLAERLLLSLNQLLHVLNAAGCNVTC